MHYSTVKKMVDSPGLRDRLIGAAAMEGRADAPMWVEQNIYRLVNVEAAIDAWEAAEVQQEAIKANGDIGARIDVINDEGVLGRVQYVLGQDAAQQQ